MKKSKFAKDVNKHREANYMTQTDLANKVGCSQPTISLIESKKKMPRAGLFLRICKSLGLDPRKFWLFLFTVGGVWYLFG